MDIILNRNVPLFLVSFQCLNIIFIFKQELFTPTVNVEKLYFRYNFVIFCFYLCFMHYGSIGVQLNFIYFVKEIR